MNAFEDARGVERRSLEILRPLISQRSFHGQYVVTNKGPLARELQKTAGDVLFNKDGETVYGVEIKAEEKDAHGNFFFETWSNRALFTLGWMYTLKSDLILYHFIENDDLYIIPFQKLRKWAFHQCRIYAYPERQQGKRAQLNDTWGRCVPIRDLAVELNLEIPYHPQREFGAAA